MKEGAPPPDPTPRARRDQGPFAPRAVFEDEWARIRKPRRDEAGIVGEPGGQGPPSHLVGLALSGGGVRSATFALGILQCFADLGLLRVFDYLSTVSGGGFTGGWWSAWLSRPETIGKGLFPLEERVEPARTEGRLGLEGRGRKVVDGSCHAHDDPIHHLRLFSNYLTPRKGTLSGDTWRAVAVISRNLVLTWIILLPLLFAAILLGKPLLFTASHPAQLYGPGLSEPAVLSQRLLIAALFPAAMFAWTTVVSIVWLILHRKESFASILGLLAAGALLAFFITSVAERHPVGVGGVVQAVAENWPAALGWALVAAFLVIGILVPQRDDEVKRNRAVRYHATLLVMIAVLSVVLMVSGFGHELVAWAWQYSRTRLGAQVAQAGGWLAVLAAVGGTVFTAFKGAPSGGRDRRDAALPSLPSRVVFALTPPLVLAVLAVVSAGAANWVVRQLYRPEYPDAPHYVTWLGLVVCSGYAVLELAEASQRSGTPWWRSKRSWLLIAATLFTIAICVPTGARDSTLRLGLAGLAAFALFLWFLASALRTRDGAARAWWLLTLVALAMTAREAFLLAARTLSAETVAWAYANAAAVAAILVLVVALGWSADPNVLSLHTFYKARLVRAYLGASNARRAKSAAEITEAVAGDNIRLSAVDGPSRGGPYHLVNTTLNLVGGRDLSTVQRSAASFVLSPLHCGSSRTGYRRTREYMTDEMTLGTALAISGAAASPNMGSITPSAALAMLMTLVNVRLGYWAPTPNRGDWKDPQARLWPVYMLREFLSQTTELSSYCYLTDGGHFDNTGLYSLVERGCRYIVLADCGADPKPCFEDLGNAIRRCRIDFGTEFDLDLTPLRNDTPADGRRHCIVGRLRYTRAHADTLGWAAEDDDRNGILVVIKPTIAGAASADVRQYALENSAFPQQTTSDQWYDEAQFESYRKLGYDSAGSAFAGLTSLGALGRRGVSSADVAALFVELQARDPGASRGA